MTGHLCVSECHITPTYLALGTGEAKHEVKHMGDPRRWGEIARPRACGRRSGDIQVRWPATAGTAAMGLSMMDSAHRAEVYQPNPVVSRLP